MMNELLIIDVLIERGYNHHSAKLVAHDLMMLSEPLNNYFRKWIHDPEVITDFSSNGFSINKLMKERGMNYPAALLTMDWLIKEPTKATASLNKKIR